MRILLIAMALGAGLALSAGTALAQGKEPTPKEIEKKRAAEDLERGYQSATKRAPGQEAPAASDPWASVRPAAEPAKAQTKKTR